MRNHDALIALLHDRARRPFAWGSHDCVRFAAAAVKVQTGRNLLTGLKWRSLKAARALIEQEGGLEAAVDSRLARVPPALAVRGDIAAVEDADFGIRLMVVEGVTLVGPGKDGLRRLPRTAAIIAWSAEV